MDAAMATRNPVKESVKAEECTKFQLHKSQQTAFNGHQHKIFDFAEHRLRRLALNSLNRERRAFLLELIKKYVNGEVAIAWRFGEPVYISITKEG